MRRAGVSLQVRIRTADFNDGTFEEVKMTPRQTRDFGQRIIDQLRVETAPSGEEGILVTERAMVRAAARDDDRVRHQVSMPLNQVPPYRRKAFQCPHRRFIPASWRSGRQVAQELREDMLTRPEKDGVGVRRCFIRQRCNMQTTQRDVCATRAIMIGNAIRAIRVRDVDLDNHEVRLVV